MHTLKKQPKTGVFFDLDGTLIDTSEDFASCINRLLKTHGRKPQSLQHTRGTISRGTKGMVAAAFSDVHDQNVIEALMAEFLGYYAKELSQKSHVFEGLESVLQWCEQEGLPWGIITNKPHCFTEPLVRALALDIRSHITLSGDSFPVCKPDPFPLLHACKETGVDPAQSLYIGDAERDIIAGNRAGMTTVVALYGYLEDTDTPEKWNARAMVSSPSALFSWIKNWYQSLGPS